jgi:hypothetical protein
MTQLASISNNHLGLHCNLCGHNSLVAVQALIDKLGKEATVHEAVPKLRCKRCKAKGQASFVITYVGGSGTAMLGARKHGDPA